MRIVPVVAITGVLVGVAAWFLLPRRSDIPRDETDAPPGLSIGPRAPTPTTDDPLPREFKTGRLVVRLKTSDGSDVPAGTTAGYVRDAVPRMRRPDRDGTFPFSDAPVGTVEAVADAPGYTSERVKVVVFGNVAAEAVVVLVPVK